MKLKIIILAVIFAISLFGCEKYNRLNELHTSGISTYDTVRLYPVKDSTKYPFWYETVLWNQINDTTWERSYFKIHYIGDGMADEIKPIKKDTIINPKFKPK